MEKIREPVTKKRLKIQRRRPGRKKLWNKECRVSKTELNRKGKAEEVFEGKRYKGGRDGQHRNDMQRNDV